MKTCHEMERSAAGSGVECVSAPVSSPKEGALTCWVERLDYSGYRAPSRLRERRAVG